MHTIYIGIGTNLGEKKQNLLNAIDLLSAHSEIKAISSIYETPALGFKSNDQFYNIVVEIESTLSPEELLTSNQKIEKQLGREYFNDGKYHSRIIDLDILLYEDYIIQTPELTIPHPQITNRNFVLIPLLEITNNLIDPLNPKNTYQNHLKKEHQKEIKKREALILIPSQN